MNNKKTQGNLTINFGFPFFRIKVDPNLWNKKEVVNIILSNYKKQNIRNKWDSHYLDESNLHHSYGDLDNPELVQPDYSQLYKIYPNIINQFLKKLKLNKKAKIGYDFQIANYTCSTPDQYMREHWHPGADFSAVHYIKFNNEHHKGTLHTNPAKFSSYLSALRPDLLKMFDLTVEENSWLNEHWLPNVEEDDMVIFPSVISHTIAKNLQTNSKDLRVTIASNIILGEYK